MHAFLDTRGSGEGLVAVKMELGIESGGQGPASLLFVERPSSAGGAGAAPGPPRSPYSQALLCPELVSLGGDSLAARPDGLWLRAQKKPKTRIPRPQGKEAEEGQRPPKVLLAEKDRGSWFDTYGPRSAWSPRLRCHLSFSGHQGTAEEQQCPRSWGPKAGRQSR